MTGFVIRLYIPRPVGLIPNLNCQLDRVRAGQLQSREIRKQSAQYTLPNTNNTLGGFSKKLPAVI